MEPAQSASAAKALKKPGIHWSEKVTWALIKLWEDHLANLRGRKHNSGVYDKIAESHTNTGLPQTWAQVLSKIDNFTQADR